MALTPNYIVIGSGNRLVLGADPLVMGYTADLGPALYHFDLAGENRQADVAGEDRKVVVLVNPRR